MPIDPNAAKENKVKSAVDKKLFSDDSGMQSSKNSMKSTGNLQKLVFGGAGMVIILTILFFTLIYEKEDSSVETIVDPQTGEINQVPTSDVDSDRPWLNPNAISDPQEVTEVIDSSGDTPRDGIVPGITDISKDTVKTNETKIVPDSFVKDLNDKDINEKWDIESIYTEVDFISYEKKRAASSPGIELYWLDATYKGKRAKVQVPFRIFKELDPVGVTVVDVEIVRVRGESRDIHEVVTGFTVRPDYKEILERSK